MHDTLSATSLLLQAIAWIAFLERCIHIIDTVSQEETKYTLISICTLVMSRYSRHHTIENVKFNYTQNVEHVIGCLGPALLFLQLLTRFLHRISPL